MASAPAAASAEKLSFAKVCTGAERGIAKQDCRADPQQIAASGLKAPSPLQNQTTSPIPKHAITSAPRERSHAATPSIELSGRTLQTQSKKLVQLAGKSVGEHDSVEQDGPEVRVHRVSSESKKSQTLPVAGGLLAPGHNDDTNTLVSSSSDSGKPPSLGGKSVESGTTFALDEKESLRPDDSASVKAAEDEDIFSAPSSAPPGSHIGSEEGVRAFRDQLREISSMEPERHSMNPQAFAASPSSRQGILYEPPQGPGVGVVPGATSSSNEVAGTIMIQPDVKLLEALESPRDRIWVLKLEQDIYDFVKDPKEASLNLPQCHAYHRMLAHKIADYYMLGHVVDDSASAVRLYKTPDCRIPPPLTGITTPSTAASTPPPSAQPMKILRRGGDGTLTSGLPSKTTSEDGDEDSKPKPPPSREEKEARYEAARLRIMGSAKPSDTPDDYKANDESRSSSAAGKKKTRKHRSDSDDGFEARSAYSAYYAQPFGTNVLSAAPYGYEGFTEAAHGMQHVPGPQQSRLPAIDQQFSGQQTRGPQWDGHGFASSSDQQWAPPQQSAYDLSGHFDRAMTLPAPTMQTHVQTSPAPTGYNTGYHQQYYGHQQPWQQSDFQAAMAATQSPYGQASNYASRSTSSPNHLRSNEPYQYGQLPSQTFPGRPSNNLEHPLPGSYKSKHFNPQSQSFIPGQPNGTAAQHFTPQGPAPGGHGYAGAYGMPDAAMRQPVAHSHASPFGSPHHSAATASQPMLHPLPQPVFPRQPSPSLPLPAKPGVPSSMPQPYSQAPTQTLVNASSIAKWGAPASLPAKPPPPAEPYDPNRSQQLQRQPSYNTAASARLPSGGIPSFATMSPAIVGLNVNGSGQQIRRA